VAGEVKFTLSEDVLLSGVQFQQREAARYGLVLAVLLATATSAAMLMDFDFRGQVWFLIASVVLGTWELIAFTTLPRRVRKELRQNPGTCQPVELRWSDAELEVSSGDSQTCRPWARLWRWRENQDVLSIYFSHDTSQIVPKRALGDAGLLNDFRSHLQEFVVQPRPPAELSLWAIGFLLSYAVPSLGFGYLLIVTGWGKVHSIWHAGLVTLGLLGAVLITASLSMRLIALLFNSAEQYEKDRNFSHEFPVVAPGRLQRLSRRYSAWIMRPAGYISRNRPVTPKE
jgi:hypothetical protein